MYFICEKQTLLFTSHLNKIALTFNIHTCLQNIKVFNKSVLLRENVRPYSKQESASDVISTYYITQSYQSLTEKLSNILELRANTHTLESVFSLIPRMKCVVPQSSWPTDNPH